MSKNSQHQNAVLGLLLLLAILSVIAAYGGMTLLETDIFRSVYQMSDAFARFALLVTQLGSVWMVMGVVGLLFVVKKNPKPALLVFRNAITAYAIAVLLKWLVDRPRPMILLEDVTSREMVVFGNGFPSAHTALATVVALTVMPYLPKKLRWLPYVWIALVAWSRLYLGVHAPLDIIGGVVIGVLVVLGADRLPWPRRLKNLKS